MGLETTYDPFEHAARLGLAVEYQSLRTARGLWLPDYRTIVLKSGMRRVDERSTLTHELAHVCLGHRDDTPKHELAADRWAVRKLITRPNLQEAALISDDPAMWCHELGVNADLLNRALSDYRSLAA